MPSRRSQRIEKERPPMELRYMRVLLMIADSIGNTLSVFSLHAISTSGMRQGW
jgi:hypothetical protein